MATLKAPPQQPKNVTLQPRVDEPVNDSRPQEIRQFVTSGISDLRPLLGRDTVLAKAELHRHLSEIRMTPAGDGKNWHYVAEGSWNLLGTGPSAPVLGLAHSDGCGGLQRSELFSAAF